MNRLVGCGLVAVGAVGICIFSYFLLAYGVAAVVAAQLPPPVQGAAWAWIQGTPQAVGRYDESDFPPGYSGQVIEAGAYYWEPMYYAGPESFVCQMPVEGGYLTSRYGDPRPGGYNHTGVDFGSNYRSEEIYSPMGGMVTHAGWSYWLGWTVVVENNGSQVILGHMCCGGSGTTSAPTGESTLQVQQGDLIEAGSVVGQTGETGNSDGIHLHFEVRRCDADGRCSIQNPSSAILPGQDPLCDWEGLEVPD
jgi:murein DD-endopeptidase MepM/ murein hydrolase activator NlpD